MRSSRHLEVAEAAWRWVLDRVRWQDGPWVPESGAVPATAAPPPDRDGLHSGVGGLAPVLAEIRCSRAWTDQEHQLAQAVGDRLRAQIAQQTDASFFDGLAGTVGALLALDRPGAAEAVERLAALLTPDGWPQAAVEPAGAALPDVTLGSAGGLLAAVWAARHGVPGAGDLAGRAAEAIVGQADRLPTGLNWRFLPADPDFAQMPNFSHGTAGVAAALAVAGHELGRPELVDAARQGAEHLVTLGAGGPDGFVVPRRIPRGSPDWDEVTYTWCHGPTGTSLLFAALERAGVPQVAGLAPSVWLRRCLHSVRTSGVPARLRPGFWDNDGRCCGTAGVVDAFLDSWRRSGDGDDLDFALRCADALVERAVWSPSGACWRFVEHRAAEPLLPPGVGWLQGAAGIAAVLFRVDRVLADGRDAADAPRLDNWWAQPGR